MNAMAWIVLAVLAVAAPLNWWGRWSVHPAFGRERWDTVTKPIVTVLVIVLALSVDTSTAARVWCVVALCFCLVGDVALLARVDRFVVGLAAFLVGHLVFVGQMAVLGFDAIGWGVAVALALIVFGLTVGRRIVGAAAASDRALLMPVSAYLLVIGIMTVAAWATGLPWAMFGAAAFVVSDTILGWARFVSARPWMSTAVMITYHLALVGLTLSLVGG